VLERTVESRRNLTKEGQKRKCLFIHGLGGSSPTITAGDGKNSLVATIPVRLGPATTALGCTCENDFNPDAYGLGGNCKNTNGLFWCKINKDIPCRRSVHGKAVTIDPNNSTSEAFKSFPKLSTFRKNTQPIPQDFMDHNIGLEKQGDWDHGTVRDGNRCALDQSWFTVKYGDNVEKTVNAFCDKHPAYMRSKIQNAKMAQNVRDLMKLREEVKSLRILRATPYSEMTIAETKLWLEVTKIEFDATEDSLKKQERIVNHEKNQSSGTTPCDHLLTETMDEVNLAVGLAGRRRQGGYREMSKQGEYNYWGGTVHNTGIDKWDCNEVWFYLHPMGEGNSGQHPTPMKALVNMMEEFQYDPCQPHMTRIISHSYGNVLQASTCMKDMWRAKGADGKKGECLYGPGQRQHKSKLDKDSCACPQWTNNAGPRASAPALDMQADLDSLLDDLDMPEAQAAYRQATGGAGLLVADRRGQPYHA
jgi:hypothetical protein